MKRFTALAAALLLVLACAGCGGAKTPVPTADADLVTVHPADTSEVLLNPGKGFVYYGGSSETSKSVQYIAAIGYHRFSWADIEPADGEYNFEKIDKQIRYYRGIGKKFAFGVMCCNTSSSDEYITPKFVFDNGAKYDLSVNGDSKQYIPQWKDEIFLGELEQFIAALGEKYNGSEDVCFIDILDYGNWGEQHLFGFHIQQENYEYDARPEPEFIRERYIEPYMRAFPDTLLVNPWGYEDLDGMYEELIEKGVTMRRDGICKYDNGLDTLAKAYGKLPVIFEYAGNYKDNIEDGTEEEFNRMLEDAIAIAKPSYIELDIDWFNNNRAYCEELANRMGYYFRLKEAAYHRGLRANGTVTLSFRNDGVAPIYEPCRVVLALLGENGPVQTFQTDCDPAGWMPAETKEERITADFSAVPAGTYRLAVGLCREGDTPAYLLGSEGKTDGGWYVLGNVTL